MVGWSSHMRELKLGIKTEREHKATYNWLKRKCNTGKCPSLNEFARHIAKDHIGEDKRYYTKLRRARL